MKRKAFIKGLSVCAILLSSIMSVAIRKCEAAEDAPYILGYAASFSPVQTTQFQHMIDEAFKVFAREEDLYVTSKRFESGEEMLKAARDGELDALISMDHMFAYQMRDVGNFSPMFTFSMYNMKTSKKCFYVKDEAGVSKYSEMKGKRLATYPEAESYFLLRDMMGEAPEKYFDMVSAKDGTSASYALAMGEADMIFISEYSVEYMKITNPGPAKSLLQLACSVPFVYPPMYASDSIPKEDVEKIIDLMSNIKNNPSFIQFKSAMKTVKMKFFPVTAEDYTEIFDVFDRAYKEGWDKDFDAWMATVEDEK